MCEPGENVAAFIEPSISVDDAEQKRSEADEDGSDSDQGHLVSSVQEASDDGREDENDERLRGTDEIEVVTVSGWSVLTFNRVCKAEAWQAVAGLAMACGSGGMMASARTSLC